MFSLGKYSKRIMLYFFVIIFSSIGYAAGESLHEAANLPERNRDAPI
jgi:hypothetical protein